MLHKILFLFIPVSIIEYGPWYFVFQKWFCLRRSAILDRLVVILAKLIVLTIYCYVVAMAPGLNNLNKTIRNITWWWLISHISRHFSVSIFQILIKSIDLICLRLNLTYDSRIYLDLTLINVFFTFGKAIGARRLFFTITILFFGSLLFWIHNDSCRWIKVI